MERSDVLRNTHTTERDLSLPQEILDAYLPGRAAFIQIDMQRRHVDPNVGYHLVDAAKAGAVVAASERLLSAVRAADAPLMHVATYSRPESPWGLSDLQSPFWKYQNGKIVPGMGRPRQMGKNMEGSVFAEILPSLAPQRNEPVVVKKRYSGFYQTDLEMMLRGVKAEMVFLWGVNTNNCVLATAYDAFSRDFCVAVVADACGSMNGDEYHHAALKQVEAALGFVTTVDEVTRALTLARAA
jgi:nicotinamidase-related amidase